MNSNALTLSLVVAAIAATVILPFSSLAAGSLVAVVGLAAVFAADYGRPLLPLVPVAEVIPFPSAVSLPLQPGKAA